MHRDALILVDGLSSNNCRLSQTSIRYHLKLNGTKIQLRTASFRTSRSHLGDASACIVHMVISCYLWIGRHCVSYDSRSVPVDAESTQERTTLQGVVKVKTVRI